MAIATHCFILLKIYPISPKEEKLNTEKNYVKIQLWNVFIHLHKISYDCPKFPKTNVHAITSIYHYCFYMKFLTKLLSFFLQPKVLHLYIVLAIIVPNLLLCFTEHLSLGASLCNIIIPGSIYAYLFTLKRKPGLMIWILFPFIFLSAFQLVLLYLFGNSIIAVDMFLNLVTTNANEALELLDNLVPAVAGVFILYIPALVFATISLRRKIVLSQEECGRLRKRAYIGMAAGAVLLTGLTLFDEEYDAKVDLFPANVCYNCYLAVERTEDVAQYKETSKDFTFNAHSTHAADSTEIYLFVIGETGRAHNWGLYGYERNTTPLLQKQEGLVHFTDVLTQSNTTHKSVPMLMSLASAEDYDRIYHEKSIITAFKEAGFYTVFFSNQKYNHAFIDIFGREADRSFFIKEEGKKKNAYDTDLLDYVDQTLAEGHRKLFIVLHTYGSHFNYRERYPETAAVFQPENVADAKPKFRENLINAYDNTIVQTDAFLNQLIERLKQQQSIAAMIYTSDHGEDIFDDDRHLFLHSSPVPSYYQLHVPFVIWTSETYRSNYPELTQNILQNQHKAVGSNASAAPTFLQMAGIETPLRIDSLSLCNDNYHIQQRHFISDHNLPETYDNIGMQEEDFLLFKKMNLTFP